MKSDFQVKNQSMHDTQANFCVLVYFYNNIQEPIKTSLIKNFSYVFRIHYQQDFSLGNLYINVKLGKKEWVKNFLSCTCLLTNKQNTSNPAIPTS